MTDRAYIDRNIGRYLKRTDYSAENITDAITAATSDVGNQLRDESNKVPEVLPAGTLFPAQLPADWRGMATVEGDVTGGVVTFRSAPIATVNRIANAYRQTRTGAAIYAVQRKQLSLAPLPVGEVRYWYFAEPAEITADPASTNDVLSVYPTMYLYRVLAECALMNQDVKLAAAFKAQFDNEVAGINIRYRHNSAGDAPAARRA